jgi:Tol biopolymer transport system component/DNA-binding winged helix-turn-helix (wHTH) protein
VSGSFRALLRGNSERIPSGVCKILTIYDFDDVRVDPRAFRVLKAGRPVAVEPKAFAVLLFLLENPGRLVEKKELLERVWPDTVVTESAMTRVIADLRKALGDAAHEARYIETVPTKGYRFIAHVRQVAEPSVPVPPGKPPAGEAPASRLSLGWIAAGVLALGLVGLVGLLVSRAPRSRPAAAPPPIPAKLTQVTESLGLDMFPTFSPDGAQIAYCSDRDGPFEIYVRQLAPGGREIRITFDGRDNFQPAWSPDGRQIAYTARAVPGIWLVPALGGEPRRLTTFGSRPSWSPDGATIAFQSDVVTDLSATAPAATPPSALWVVPAAGGEPESLTRPGSPVGGHGAPAFSPDGTEVVFATWTVHGELWSVSRKDGSLRRILPRDEDAAKEAGASFQRGYFDPAFSPKGDVLYFAATDQSWLNASLWRSRAPAGPGGRWGAPEHVTPDGTTSVRQIAVSPRTGTVAYAALSIVSNLWSLPVDPKTSVPTGEAVLLTRGAGCRTTSPRFSPDGSKIAFVSCRAGSSTDLWLMDRDGGGARPLTDGSSETHFPSWFPGGDRIAYFTIREGAKGLWAVTLEDRSQRRILPLEADVSRTRLSFDGRFLAYTTGSPDRGLAAWVAPLDGGLPRRVTSPDASAGFPCWSRDGRSLAVEVLRPPNTFLATVLATGGEPAILVHEKGLSWPSDWSPDDERISFAGQRDGIWNVYWVARRGGPEHRLTENVRRRAILLYPVWSPQNDRIVYEHSETTGNIWLMDLPR